jgi:hypothetical protein
MKMCVQAVEACPFLDEDERIGCLDGLVRMSMLCS